MILTRRRVCERVGENILPKYTVRGVLELRGPAFNLMPLERTRLQ